MFYEPKSGDGHAIVLAIFESVWVVLLVVFRAK
jgi:hypothetical protein